MPAISGPLMMSRGAAPSAQFAVEIGDQAVLGAFDDVVGQALIQRQILGVLLHRASCLAEMLRDGGDVPLVQGGLLLGASALANPRAPCAGLSFPASTAGELKSRLSARRRSFSGMEAKRSSFSALTMARSRPALVQ